MRKKSPLALFYFHGAEKVALAFWGETKANATNF